jgi:hypothetical protein
MMRVEATSIEGAVHFEADDDDAADAECGALHAPCLLGLAIAADIAVQDRDRKKT